MDLATAISELWRRRRWVAAVAVIAVYAAILTAYRVEGFPPRLEKKSLEFGAAAAQILIDSPGSTLADLRREFTPLAERAQVYSQFMASPAVKDAIAETVGLPPSVVVAEASVATENLPRSAVEPGQGERANQLLEEGVGYRLSFEAQEDLPIVSVRAQAPTAAEAVRLADGAAIGLTSYLRKVEEDQQVPVQRRVRIVPLGGAKGGVVNSGVNRVIAALAFVAVFGIGCVAILVAVNVAEGLRSQRRGAAATAAGRGGTGSARERSRTPHGTPGGNGKGKRTAATGRKAAERQGNGGDPADAGRANGKGRDAERGGSGRSSSRRQSASRGARASDRRGRESRPE